MMYESQAKGGIKEIQDKLKTIDEEKYAILVLYKDQVYMISSAWALQIHMHPLSGIFYKSARDGKLWRFNTITTLKFDDNDPEFMTVLDQALINDPILIEYIRVQKPRYSEHEEYYVMQIKSLVE